MALKSVALQQTAWRTDIRTVSLPLLGMACNQFEINACDDIHRGLMQVLPCVYGKTRAVKITQAAKMPPLFCQNPVNLAI
jgi:hypothetical protein